MTHMMWISEQFEAISTRLGYQAANKHDGCSLAQFIRLAQYAISEGKGGMLLD